MKNISFKTLGCRLNQYETDALVSNFDKSGYNIVGFDDRADVTVINTCTVTNQSDHKSRNTISQAARKNTNGIVVVTGCMADNYKAELEKQDNITYVVDNSRKSSIVELIDAHFKGEILHPEKLPQNAFNFETVDKSLHTRTSIKIQDGCDNFCSFCIIPSVRGKAVSRPVDDILDNVKSVVANGFKEIVITGVNISRYEFGGLGFADIIERILYVPGDFRVRISSMEPDQISHKFLDLFEHPKLTRHLHLCLQSGSDNILLKMRRMYSVKSFVEITQKLKQKYPDFNFTTDIIVGFPGESQSDFEQSKQAATEISFSHIHTFRYSKRDGTRAERMPDQINEKVKAERAEEIRLISEANKERYYQSMLGKEQKVLIEKVKDGIASGYGEHYIPVRFKAPQAEKNTWAHVILEEIIHDNDLLVQAKLV